MTDHEIAALMGWPEQYMADERDPLKLQAAWNKPQSRDETEVGEAKWSITGLDKRVGSDDLTLVVTAIDIARRTGGNLTEIFDKISLTIRNHVPALALVRGAPHRPADDIAIVVKRNLRQIRFLVILHHAILVIRHPSLRRVPGTPEISLTF